VKGTATILWAYESLREGDSSMFDGVGIESHEIDMGAGRVWRFSSYLHGRHNKSNTRSTLAACCLLLIAYCFLLSALLFLTKCASPQKNTPAPIPDNKNNDPSPSGDPQEKM
jgi:hypothetical protein